jgi:AraC-like DNA-binding protein
MRNLKHFFKTQQVIDSSFSIRGIGIEEVMRPGMVDRPIGTGDWLIMYFHSQCQIMDQQAPAGSLIIWEPGDYQKYGKSNDHWQHSWMHCEGAMLGRWLKQTHLPSRTVLADLPCENWDESLSRIFDELQQQDRFASRMILNLMHNAMMMFGRLAHADDVSTDIPESMLKVRQKLETHFSQAFDLDTLAQMAELSISHFCAQFKQAFGCSAIEYLIQQRMQQAAYLLYDRNLRIQEISQRVGYDDVFHFSKMFKKHHGISPRALRKQQLGD